MPLGTKDITDPIVSLKDLSSELAQRVLSEQTSAIPLVALTETEIWREQRFGFLDALKCDIIPALFLTGIGGALGKDWPTLAQGMVAGGALFFPAFSSAYLIRLLKRFEKSRYAHYALKYVLRGRAFANLLGLGSVALAWPHVGLPVWAKMTAGGACLIGGIPYLVWLFKEEPPAMGVYQQLVEEKLSQAERAKLNLEKLISLATQKGITVVGPGIRLYDGVQRKAMDVDELKREKVRLAALSAKDRSVHAAVVAGTGGGKTYTASWLVRQDLREGYSLVLVDPKGDSDFLDFLVQEALLSNRLQDLVFITPYWSEVSDPFNPLLGYDSVDEAQAVVSAVISYQVPASGDAVFFRRYGERISRAILSVLLPLYKQGRRGAPTWRDIVLYSAEEKLGSLIAQARELRLESVVTTIEDLLASGPKYGQFRQTLTTALDPFIASETASRVLGADRNVIAERVRANRPFIAYVRTESLSDPDMASGMVLAVIGALKALSAAFLRRGAVIQPSIRLHVDEAYRALFKGFEDVLDKGRSAGLHATLYFQDYSQLVQQVGRDLARTMLANMKTVLFFQVVSRETSELISELLPSTEKVAPMLLFSSGAQQQARASVRDQNLVEETEGIYLREREFILKTPRDVWRGFVPRIPKPLLHVCPPGAETDCQSIPDALRALRRGQPARIALVELAQAVRERRGEEGLPVDLSLPQEERRKETEKQPPSSPARAEEKREEGGKEPSPSPPSSETGKEEGGRVETDKPLLEELRSRLERKLGEGERGKIEEILWWVSQNWDRPSFTHVREKHQHIVYRRLAEVSLGEHSVRAALKGLDLLEQDFGTPVPALVYRVIAACLLHDAGKTTAVRGADHPGESVKIAISLGIDDETILNAIAHHHQPLNKLKEPVERYTALADREARWEEIKALEGEGFKVLRLEEAVDKWLSEHSLTELEEMAFATQKSLAEKEGRERPIWKDEREGVFWADPDLVALPLSRAFLDWEKEGVIVSEAMFTDHVKPVLAEALREKGLLASKIGRGYYAAYVSVPLPGKDGVLRQTRRAQMIGWLSPGSSQEKEEGTV